MRRLLDAIYDGAAGLAAVFMVGLLVMVLLSVLGRQLHFHLPGTGAFLRSGNDVQVKPPPIRLAPQKSSCNCSQNFCVSTAKPSAL